MADFGYRPLPANLLLNTGADFDVTVTQQVNGLPQPWGTVQVQFEFENGTVWPATVTGADAVFTRPRNECDALAANQRVELIFVDGAHRIVYSSGRVFRA